MFYRIKSRISKLFLKKALKERSEWQIFFQRNRIHVFLTIICIILCIKQSPAPFLWKYNRLTNDY